MQKDYTHICIILDSSSSMDCVKKETKATFNRFMDSQRKIPGKTVFDLFLFWDKVKRSVSFADLRTFKSDLMAEYRCSGCTALYDAICYAVDALGQDFSKMQEDERPENVLVAIITDGEENSSRRYTLQDVQTRIEHQTKVYNWEFIFLAANIDVAEVGDALGVVADNRIAFEQSPAGMEQLESVLNERADSVRRRK